MKTKKNLPVAKPELSLLDLEIRRLSPRKRKKRAYVAGRHLIKAGYEVNHHQWSFQTGFTTLEEIPVPTRYYARQLLRLGYYHQLKLII